MMVKRAQSTEELSLLFGGTPLRAKEKILFGNGFKNGAMIAISLQLSLAVLCLPFIL
jgi:predicted esterase